jgi:Glutathione S-transferase N-terminal domain
MPSAFMLSVIILNVVAPFNLRYFLLQFPRGRTTISLSPFPIKVETFLRMNGIEYVNDYDYPYSPDKHKSPWITVNGEDVSDSQLVVEFLARKFGVESR